LILSGIIANGTCKLYKIADDTNQYKKMERTISKKNKKSTISSEQINESLIEKLGDKLNAVDHLYLIHDPSDIRKPYSEKTENLGKVRDLNGNIINGFSTHNTIAVLPKDKSVHLVSHESYSNKDPKFLKAEIVKKLEQNKEFANKEEYTELYESNQYINKKIITTSSLKATSDSIKKYNSEINITHVLDREFVDDEYFEYIQKQLKDKFIIRSKKSRCLLDKKDENNKAIKLIESNFKNKDKIKVEKFNFKIKVYQNAKIEISWDKYGDNHAIKINIKDRKDKDIFKDSMLLITNIKINNINDSYMVYLGYLKRSKIEYVFKFLKEGLGWEEMQLGDFEAIQNLLSLCFFVSSYLYEIGEEIVHDDYAIILADLGGGKGKVTRHYILEGIKQLMSKHRVDRILEKHKPSEQTINNMNEAAGLTLCID